MCIRDSMYWFVHPELSRGSVAFIITEPEKFGTNSMIRKLSSMSMKQQDALTLSLYSGVKQCDQSASGYQSLVELYTPEFLKILFSEIKKLNLPE